MDKRKIGGDRRRSSEPGSSRRRVPPAPSSRRRVPPALLPEPGSSRRRVPPAPAPAPAPLPEPGSSRRRVPPVGSSRRRVPGMAPIISDKGDPKPLAKTERDRANYVQMAADREVHSRLEHYYNKYELNNDNDPYDINPIVIPKNIEKEGGEALRKYKRKAEKWRFQMMGFFQRKQERDEEAKKQKEKDEAADIKREYGEVVKKGGVVIPSEVRKNRIPKDEGGKYKYETVVQAAKKAYKSNQQRIIENANLDKKLSDEENAIWVEKGGRHILWGLRGSETAKDYAIDDADIFKEEVTNVLENLLGKGDFSQAAMDKVLESTNVGNRKKQAVRLLKKIKEKYPKKDIHLVGHSLGGHLVKHLLVKNKKDKTLKGYGFNSAQHREFHNKLMDGSIPTDRRPALDPRYKGYRTAGRKHGDIVSRTGDANYKTTTHIANDLHPDSPHHHYMDFFPDLKEEMREHPGIYDDIKKFWEKTDERIAKIIKKNQRKRWNEL